MPAFDDGLYGGYSTYANWTTKSASAKSFPWNINCGLSTGPAMTPQLGTMTPQTPSGVGSGTTPYNVGASPYFYNRDQCSDSITSLRLKAKHHTGLAPYGSLSTPSLGGPLSTSTLSHPALAAPTLTPNAPPSQSFSACQYSSFSNSGHMT